MNLKRGNCFLNRLDTAVLIEVIVRREVEQRNWRVDNVNDLVLCTRGYFQVCLGPRQKKPPVVREPVIGGPRYLS